MANIARALSIEHYRSPEADKEVSNFVRAIRRAQKANANERLPRTIDEMAVTSDDSNAALESRREYIKAVIEIKQKFGDRIIRRTIQSKDDTGKPISGLQPPVMVTAYVSLKQEEMDMLQGFADRKNCNVTAMFWGTFSVCFFLIVIINIQIILFSLSISSIVWELITQSRQHTFSTERIHRLL